MPRWIIKRKSLILFLAITVGIGGWLTFVLTRAEDKTALLPGVTTHGHHQIEMQCSACHENEENVNIFTSSGVSNKSCLECHGEALENFSDSHPIRKFKNPENYIFLQHIDAMQCVTCHREHNEKITGEMAVTIPSNYCAHCHEVTLENLESHRDLAFNSCATAGCHNYHDNMALAPSFLLKHYGEPAVLAKPVVSEVNTLERWLAEGNKSRAALTQQDADSPSEVAGDVAVLDEWHQSSHAAAGINCSDCHGGEKDWVAKPGLASCKNCHEVQVADFTQGKHGMRLAHAGLAPMKVADARKEMLPEAAHKSVSCNSCHPAHSDDRTFAAAEACITCHADNHTVNYAHSPHAKLWEAEVAGTGAPGSGVSCATCHMPREERDGEIIVNHDQTANLTPNEKMLRNVCMNCHGLQFGMDALADRSLIESNFTGRPSAHHPGIDWTVESAIERGDERVIELKKTLRPEPETSGPAEHTQNNTKETKTNKPE